MQGTAHMLDAGGQQSAYFTNSHAGALGGGTAWAVGCPWVPLVGREQVRCSAPLMQLGPRHPPLTGQVICPRLLPLLRLDLSSSAICGVTGTIPHRLLHCGGICLSQGLRAAGIPSFCLTSSWQRHHRPVMEEELRGLTGATAWPLCGCCPGCGGEHSRKEVFEPWTSTWCCPTQQDTSVTGPGGGSCHPHPWGIAVGGRVLGCPWQWDPSSAGQVSLLMEFSCPRVTLANEMGVGLMGVCK